ncbi:MAG: transposase [Candidatus Paceibacterota bacterium]|jgi:REP element-mobilizing transposase RayT
MIRYNPDIHHRRSIRLNGYDYSQAGAYFVTICVHERECLLGEIVDEEMQLNQSGRIVAAEWIRLGELRKEIELGESVVMPNHFHGVVIFNEYIGVGAIHVRAIHELPLHQHESFPPIRQQRRKMALPTIIGRFKMITAKRINIDRDTPGVPVWQRNYHEHIIRNETDYNRIAEYIASNPQRWIEDKLHPENIVGAAENNARCNIVGAIHELPLRELPLRRNMTKSGGSDD